MIKQRVEINIMHRATPTSKALPSLPVTDLRL